MINKRRFISYAIVALLAALGSLALSAERASSQPGCEVLIENIAHPPIDTPFDFSVPGGTPSSFTLMNPSDATVSLFFPFNSGEVILTEEVPLGWRLDQIVCETPEFSNVVITEGPSPNEVTFECFGKKKAKESPVCSFINILEVRNIPTLSEWGLIILAVALGVFSLFAGRKKLTKS